MTWYNNLTAHIFVSWAKTHTSRFFYLIDKIESVQRRFTKRLPGYISLDYPARLISLEQCSLEKRRIVHDLVLMYKFVFKLVDVQTSIFFTLRNDAVPSRGNPYKVLLKVSQTNVRCHFFHGANCLYMDSLPPSVVDFRSLSSFKRTIYNAHVNLFTRYWCAVLSLNWHCMLFYLHNRYDYIFSLGSKVVVCIFVLFVWYVSGLWPFIANKLILDSREKGSETRWGACVWSASCVSSKHCGLCAMHFATVSDILAVYASLNLLTSMRLNIISVFFDRRNTRV